MGNLHGKFYSCLRLQFPDVETNPGPWCPVAASCRILGSNVRGLSRNLSDLAVAYSQYDIRLCSETWSQICVTCQSCWFLGSVALSCHAGASCLLPVGWRHMYEMDMEYFTNQNLSVVAEKCWLLVFVVPDRTFMCIVFTVFLTKMTTYMTVY